MFRQRFVRRQPGKRVGKTIRIKRNSAWFPQNNWETGCIEVLPKVLDYPKFAGWGDHFSIHIADLWPCSAGFRGYSVDDGMEGTDIPLFQRPQQPA